jgi:uncharacterized protein (TIGR02996 family)
VARFERGSEFVEVWLAAPEQRARSGSAGPRSDAERRAETIDPTGNIVYRWPELLSRAGRIGDAAETVTLDRRYEWSARDDYQRFQSQRLRDGWHRVADPDHEMVYDEPINAELDAALRADPDDASAALVYADWLQQRQHPRGKLIVAQHARLERPDDAELAAAEAELLEAHIPELYGALWSRLRPAGARKGDGGIDVTWWCGFIRYARITGFQESGSSEDTLWELLRHPSARFLRELDIGCHRSGDQDNVLMSDLLVHAGPTPPLRKLVLADFDDSEIDNIDISRAPIGDLTGLGERYPELEDVVLKGTGDVVLGDLRLPNARRFALRTSTLTRTTLASIVRAPWPVLEELELWFGDPDRGYGADCELADAVALLRRPLPKLRVLRVMNAMFSDEIVSELVAWSGAAQLEQLDFGLGTLSDVGAAALVAARSAFPKLERLGVFENALTPAGLAQLRAAFPVDDRAISPAYGWREPRQKPARYASVSE